MVFYRPAELDSQAMIHLRQEMADYLGTIEVNINALDNWILENEGRIITLHGELMKALHKKNARMAVSVIKDMCGVKNIHANERKRMIEEAAYYRAQKNKTKKDAVNNWLEAETDVDIALCARDRMGVASFILTLQNFHTSIIEVFGENSVVARMISVISPHLPSSLLQPLPEISLEGRDVFMKVEKNQKGQAPEEIQTLKDEILNLHHHSHYYIDSLMDWAVDRLSGIDKEVSDKKKMQKYQDPLYVVERARKEYDIAVEEKIKKLRTTSLRVNTRLHSILKQAAFKRICPAPMY